LSLNPWHNIKTSPPSPSPKQGSRRQQTLPRARMQFKDAKNTSDLQLNADWTIWRKQNCLRVATSAQHHVNWQIITSPIVACTIRVRSAVQRHQRPISSPIYPKRQLRQVIMNVLHPSCARPPRWSPPVLWRRFKDGLLLRHHALFICTAKFYHYYDLLGYQ